MKREEIGFKAIETAKKACDSIDGMYEYANGFVIGAEWRINSVWHSVSQSPERNKIYLAQLGEEAFDTFYDSENWDSFSKGLNIVRWAYIDDLTPKEE